VKFKKVELADKYFGRELHSNNKVYQLTWQNNEGYVYNADTFKKEKTFTYFKPIEGWGLTNDGKIYTNRTEPKNLDYGSNNLKK
jgi:glutamine cyclotransferase